MITAWHADLDRSTTLQDVARDVLSADEHALADAIHLEVDRRRYRAARTLLRLLVGRELDCASAEIAFGTGPQGKPFVSTPATDLVFSVSHSVDRVIVALGSARRLGVDVERVREDIDYPKLSRRLFSPRERAQLEALPSEVRAAAFCRAWTLKEALVKAQGEGLFTLRLDELEVTIDPDAPATTTSPGFWVTDFPIDAAYRAALASDGPSAVIVTRTWSP